MRTAALLTLSIAAPLTLAHPIAIDERFSDWDGIAPIATDPAGDSTTGAFDVTQLWATNAGSVLFLSFDDASVDGPFNLQEGEEANGKPRLSITTTDGRSLTVHHRARSAWLDGNRSNVIDWNTLGYRLLPTVASRRYEVAIDLSVLGVAQGDTVQIAFEVPDFASEEITDPAPDAFASPVSYTMTDPEVVPARRTVERAQGTTLRVASMNVLSTGLLIRPDPFFRMFRAVDADVYLLSEIYSSAGSVQFRFDTQMPLPDGQSWHITSRASRFGSTPSPTDGDEYIVSKRPTTLIASTAPAEGRTMRDTAIALVGDDPETAVLVLSVHWRCCGHTGSGSDSSRIVEVAEITEFIEAFRAGTAEPELVPFAGVPIILAGDWNLVGSNLPRELLTEHPAGPGFEHLIIRDLIGADTVTWRERSGIGFTPGLLDLMVYSPGTITAKKSFLLDTAKLNSPELTDLGLFATDSADASDHLLLVADFAQDSGCSVADTAAPFGTLNIDDVLAYLTAFASCTGTADIAAPTGTCNIDDVLAFLGAFADGCP